MQDLKRRFEDHLAADEASLVRIEKYILAINGKLEKFENNHFAHIEPDIRTLKDFSLRMERGFGEIISELKQNTKDTQDAKVEFAVKFGELNTKIASLESRGGANFDWVKTLIMLLVSAIVGAGITFMIGR